jgi:hypothetical protein
MIKEQLPVPEHPPPLHPVKTEPLLAVAVRATDVPALYIDEQVEPQFILVSALVTVPLPVPVFEIVRVY